MMFSETDTIQIHFNGLFYQFLRLKIVIVGIFTPLESSGIYAGDVRNRKHQLLIEGGVKAPYFLTGFTVTV